jgi:hypothetical protein
MPVHPKFATFIMRTQVIFQLEGMGILKDLIQKGQRHQMSIIIIIITHLGWQGSFLGLWPTVKRNHPTPSLGTSSLNVIQMKTTF